MVMTCSSRMGNATVPNEHTDAFQAARLLQWGLRSKARPVQEPEYRELVQRYFDSSEFRTLVRQIADGLGLRVLEANEHGLFLCPTPESIFSFRPADFRPGRASAEERLLVGLIQIAIAATIYPRQRDLDEPSQVARQPVTVEEIDGNIRAICDSYAHAASAGGDPDANELGQGMEEAWRIYQKRVSVAQTKGGGQGRRTTHHLIRQTLDRLCELGCFTREGDERSVFRPTMRYQVAVKEMAAVEMFRHVQDAIAQAASPQGGD
jgi:hypothetical protein